MLWYAARHGLNYHLYAPTPPPSNASDSQLLPLVMHFHGGVWTNFDALSERELNATTPFFESLQPSTPHFALRPIAKRRQSWVSPHIGPLTGSHRLTKKPPTSLALAMAALDHVLDPRAPADTASAPVSPLHAPLRVDRGRMLVAGSSMGGYAAWEYIMRRPELFEAAIPICGGGDPQQAHALAHIRIWAFHARDDDRVPVNASREMFDAIVTSRRIPAHRVRRTSVGEPGTAEEAVELSVTPLRPHEQWAELRYTEYLRGGHNAWLRALADPRLPGWWLGGGGGGVSPTAVGAPPRSAHVTRRHHEHATLAGQGRGNRL